MTATDERDFGLIIREDGVWHVWVGTDENGDKVKTREEKLADDDPVAYDFVAHALYGDGFDTDQKAELDEWVAEHGLGPAFLRWRYAERDKNGKIVNLDAWNERVAAAEAGT